MPVTIKCTSLDSLCKDYEFTVNAVNAGTIDGMVSVVSNKLNGTEITTLPNYLEYKVSYADDVDTGLAFSWNGTLAAGESVTKTATFTIQEAPISVVKVFKKGNVKE